MKICKYCGQRAKLVKAHIIPKSFFTRISHPSQPNRMLSNVEGSYPKKARIGEYDTGLLCESCERLFQVWDDYAAKFVNTFEELREPLYDKGVLVGYQVENFDYDRLKLFFISMLWRAAKSERQFFHRVQLTPKELHRAKTLIETNDPGKPQTFGVCISTMSGLLGETMFDPILEKFGGLKFARFYLGPIIAYIKLANKSAPTDFQSHFMRPNAPLIVIERSTKGSPELPVALAIAKQNR